MSFSTSISPWHQRYLAVFALSLLSCVGVRSMRAQTPGSLDTSFQDPFVQSVNDTAYVSSIAVQADGKVLIVGGFTSVNGAPRNSIARLNEDGSLDTGFNPGVTGADYGVYSVAVQADGRVLIGGDFTSVNGAPRNGIARLNADGSLDTGFNPGVSGTDYNGSSVAVQADGKVLIEGRFTRVNGVTRNRIARLNADGSVDTGFDAGSGPDYGVYSLAVQPDGKVLIGGEFGTVNGLGRFCFARLNADGSVDTGFAPAVGSYVYAIAVQADGKVLIGGNFDGVNRLTRHYIARLNADGSLDMGFNPDADLPVYSLAVQPDGKVLIGGDFGTVNRVPRLHIARLNADGSVDTGFDLSSGLNYLPGPNALVRSIVVQADGKVLIGGDFTDIDGVPRHGVARLLGGDAAPTITSAATAQGRATEPFFYQITATNTPTSYSATGLPNGLVLDPLTGLISGTTSLVGSYNISLGAANGAGTGTLNLALLIVPAPTPTPTLTPVPTAAVSVQLTSPLDGATLDAGANLSFAAFVVDPGNILASVTFYLGDGAVAQIGAAGPFVYNTVAPAPGTYRLSVVAVDLLGRQSTSTHTVTVQAPADPTAPVPVGQIISDLNHRAFAAGAIVPVTAAFSTPSADDPIVRVDFYDDDQVFASLVGAGNPIASAVGNGKPVRQDASALKAGSVYTANFTMPGSDKLINLVAVALSKLGHTQVSNAVTVQAVSATSNHPPVLKVGSPTANSRVRVGATAAVPVSVSDPDAGNPSGVIAKMEYYQNALKVKDTAQAPFGYDLSPPSAGTYVLTVIATDGAGLSTVSAPVKVEAFVAPTVSLAVKGSAQVSEAGGKAKFLVARDGTDLSTDLTVLYKTKGSARKGSDYQTVGGSVVIPAGAASVKLKVKAIDNASQDGTRTLQLKLLASPEGEYDVAKGLAKKTTVSILDND